MSRARLVKAVELAMLGLMTCTTSSGERPASVQSTMASAAARLCTASRRLAKNSIFMYAGQDDIATLGNFLTRRGRSPPNRDEMLHAATPISDNGKTGFDQTRRDWQSHSAQSHYANIHTCLPSSRFH